MPHFSSVGAYCSAGIRVIPSSFCSVDVVVVVEAEPSGFIFCNIKVVDMCILVEHLIQLILVHQSLTF
jgi:hypothetical protein